MALDSEQPLGGGNPPDLGRLLKPQGGQSAVQTVRNKRVVQVMGTRCSIDFHSGAFRRRHRCGMDAPVRSYQNAREGRIPIEHAQHLVAAELTIPQDPRGELAMPRKSADSSDGGRKDSCAKSADIV